MNKSFFKLCKLEFGIACCFNILIGIWYIGYFFLYFAQQSYKLERWALKMHILWCRTDICNCKLSAKVSLMLDNPFLIPCLCKLNHISVCFIQISTKWNYLQKRIIPASVKTLQIKVLSSRLMFNNLIKLTEIL